MFKNIRVSTCLFLLMLVFFVMQLASSGLSLFSSNRDYQSLTLVTNASEQRGNLSKSWIALIQTRNALNRASTRLALNQPDENIAPLLQEAGKSLTLAHSYYKAFLDLPRRSQAGIELTQANKVLFDKLDATLANLIDVLGHRDLTTFLNGSAQQDQDAFEQSYLAFIAHIDSQFNDARQQTEMAYQQAVMIAIVAIVILVLITPIAITIIRRILFKPLNIMREHFDRIGAGDISGEIVAEGRYEIKMMLASLQQMQHSLATTVRTVRQGADVMFNGLKEISAGNHDLSARTEQQASSLEETAASMEQLTATVKQNAENASQATQLAKDASNTASKGGEITGNVVQTMQDIAGSSKKISAITSVIDGIAFQTNILALNAAVEAARAGEQGRGFAVVAGEVRTLAQRSAQAAKEIKELIDESVSRVTQGTVLVTSAGSTMDDIVRAVTRVSDIMGEIASASAEQSQGIEQVSLAVTQMDQVTQQNAALVQQAAAATLSLEEQSLRLTEAVAVFQLAAEPSSPRRSGQYQARAAAGAVAFTPRQTALAAGDRSESSGGWETF
ncbi:HAMP domain-containing protein [Rahnella sp. SAP-1]|uniref:HAMP domain-containing protein n=1 Tax=Rouxiella aceris TaxID=2703884 RepID=A0A848MLN4_9GAMM|nr:methyl-accepting chemotaxis protein [Rouxiella aceris]NMP28019.1 HAMP domain-containing protein [Rouxiella aceris]